jgi:hypothetical protein
MSYVYLTFEEIASFQLDFINMILILTVCYKAYIYRAGIVYPSGACNFIAGYW